MNTKDIFDILPISITSIIEKLKDFDSLQEIRLKVNKPLIIYSGNKENIFNYIITRENINTILQRISGYSIYAFEEEIKQGYLTIKGGHRVGICGTCVIENYKVKTIKSIGSLNIRISKEVVGCSNKLMQYFFDKGNLVNTIIISPPKCGKTTLIRDISRNLSDGFKLSDKSSQGIKVCVIDERSEIGSCYNGIPQMNIGIRTDILDNCMKSEGIMMAIRSMAPDVIICDELGTLKDVDSVLMAMNSGVKLITTIHGYGIEDLEKRAVFKEILENKVFERAIILSSRNGAGTVEQVYNLNNKEKLWRR